MVSGNFMQVFVSAIVAMHLVQCSNLKDDTRNLAWGPFTWKEDDPSTRITLKSEQNLSSGFK